MPENSLTGGALAAITKTALLIINPVSGRRNVIRYVAKAVRRLMPDIEQENTGWLI